MWESILLGHLTQESFISLRAAWLLPSYLMEAKGMKTIYCLHRKATWIFCRKSVEYKINISGENPTPLECCCYSQGLPGHGTKSGVIPVRCAALVLLAELGLWGSDVHAHLQAGRCFILFFSEAQASCLWIIATKIHLSKPVIGWYLKIMPHQEIWRENRSKEAFIGKKKL